MPFSDALHTQRREYNGRVRVPETGDEIQQHIDDLAGSNVDIGNRDHGLPDVTPGGVVKLLPKVYEVHEPIRLRAGIQLEGTRPSINTFRTDVRATFSQIVPAADFPDTNPPSPIIGSQANTTAATAENAGFILRHFQIGDGPDYTGSYSGIWLDASGSSWIEKVLVRHTESDPTARGLVIQGQQDLYMFQSAISDLDFYSERDNPGSGSKDIQGIVFGGRHRGIDINSSQLWLFEVEGGTTETRDFGLRSRFGNATIILWRVQFLSEPGQADATHMIDLQNAGRVWMTWVVATDADNGLRVNSVSPGIWMDHCEFVQCNNAGVLIDDSQVIRDAHSSRFSENGNYGIEFRGTPQPHSRVFSRCEFDGNGQYGVYHESFNQNEGPTFLGCYFTGNGTAAVNDLNEISIRNPRGGQLINENMATFQADGDGTTDTFTVPHQFSGDQPAWVDIQYKDAALLGNTHYWAADSTNITVTFADPPPSGTGNVHFAWHALGESYSPVLDT